MGQRDDPFFVDLGATFDAINVREGTGNQGGGKDDLSGYSTSATVLQIPQKRVTKNGKPVSGPTRATRSSGCGPARIGAASRSRTHSHGPSKAHGKRNRFVQVSRLGNPLVNEVVIPLGQKDRFNRTTPKHDAANYGKFVLKPELAAILNALFGVNAPENNRTDIVQALLQGIPNLNQHSGPHAGKPVDTLKINLGIPPTQDAESLRRDRRGQRRVPERPPAQ